MFVASKLPVATIAGTQIDGSYPNFPQSFAKTTV